MQDMVNISPTDPLGHYSALGVGPLSDAAEIKAAYRYKAKLLHPDRNPSDEAGQEFLRVVEAYQVLRDPRMRARYDASYELPGPAALIDPEDPAPQPLACSRCGKITAQPRYIIFEKVKSFLLRTRRTPVRGIFCRDCADRTAILASTATWMAGWWGVKGPYHTLKALWKNLRGGDMPQADNLWVILHQARAFLALGDNRLARALAEQARAFAKDDEERIRIDGIVHAAGPDQPKRRLKNRWRRWSYAAVMQALPLGALAVAATLAATVLVFRSQTDSATAMITVHPARPGEIRHVAVDVLKVRQGPAPSQPVIALLDRFATVQVMDAVAGGEWARILTATGVTGYVPSRFLFAGPGNVPKSRWCTDARGEPPRNGEILLRRTGGEHRLEVKNAVGRDVVVRLKTPSGRTLLAFFLAAQSTAVINAIPDGNFRTVFATGRDYSRACGTFLEDMRTFIVPTAQVFHTSYQGVSTLRTDERAFDLTMAPIGEGPGQSHPLPLESYLDN
jgi:curved DNA-binding protein CbpA